MRLRILGFIVLAGVLGGSAFAQVPPAPPAPPSPPAPPAPRAQSGGEPSSRTSQKVKLGRQGSVSISNIAGNIVVTGVGGDEVSIEAVKHGSDINVVVQDRAGRVDIRAEPGPGEGHSSRMRLRGMRDDQPAVDFTLTIPSDATVDAHSVSGDIKITAVQGSVRAETVSGSVVAAKTPHVERAKSISGDVDLSDVSSDTDLTAGSVSGSLRAKGLKARGLDLNTVSGDVTLANITCDHVGIRSVSGNIQYDGPLARSGRYEMNSHSGNVHLALTANTGFELNASSFSGSIRSDLPLTIGGTGSGSGAGAGSGDRSEVRRRGMGQSVHATYGDGSALVTIRTFSGDVIISKRQGKD